MEREEVEKFAKSLVEVIWEKYEEDKLGDYYHEDLDGHYNDDVVSYDLLKKKLHIFKNHMQGLKVEIKDLIIEDNAFVLHAFQKLRDLSIQTMLVCHLKDGKIKSYWLKTEMPLEFN